ncbi:MAG: hypothetical protein ACYCQI_08335 [Gammaproteobacteria bacterium]
MFRALKSLVSSKNLKNKEKAPLDTKWVIPLSTDVLQTVFEYQSTDDALILAQASDQAKAAYKPKFGARSPQYLAEQMVQSAPEKKKKGKTQEIPNTMQSLLNLYGSGHPALASYKGSVKDGNRLFQNITAFQYTILKDQKDMQKTLLAAMSKDAAKAQIKELKSNGFQYQLLIEDKKAEEKHQKDEAALKKDIDFMFEKAEGAPLKLSIVIIASAQCVYREAYTKALNALRPLLDDPFCVEGQPFRGYMMGRVLWAAKMMNDTETLNRYIPQLYKILASKGKSEDRAFALSMLAIADDKNYKSIQPHMWAMTEHLKEWYNTCVKYAASNPDKVEEAKPYIQEALTHYVWSLVLNFLAALKGEDYSVRSLVRSALEEVGKSHHPVDGLLNIPEDQGQAWAIGLMRANIFRGRLPVVIIPRLKAKEYHEKFAEAFDKSIQSAREKNLVAPALMGTLSSLKKEGVTLIQCRIPDLKTEVNHTFAKPVKDQEIPISTHVPHYGHKFKIRNVYLQEDNTLAVVAYLKNYGGGCLEPIWVGDKVKVKVEETLPIKLYTVDSLQALKQKKAEFKNAKCIYAKKLQRKSFFPLIEIDPNAPRIEKDDDTPPLPKVVKINRRT